MPFRTVVIKNRCKLEYSLNYMVIRSDETKRINLNEISTVIIQNTGVAVTTALLVSLVDKKIKVIMCDTKSNPCFELTPYYSSHNNYEKILEQINYNKKLQGIIWKYITQRKIINQAKNLKYANLTESYDKLMRYSEDVDIDDVTNREGHAAKVYFYSLFGSKFSRDLKIDTNMFLNYGYSIILSSINRAIKFFGYLTEIGIHHIGKTNPFNLSCDLMEPLRPLVDYLVISGKVDKDNYKSYLINMLNMQVTYEGNKMYLDNAIKRYVENIFLILKKNIDVKPSFIEYEL